MIFHNVTKYHILFPLFQFVSMPDKQILRLQTVMVKVTRCPKQAELPSSQLVCNSLCRYNIYICMYISGAMGEVVIVLV